MSEVLSEVKRVFLPSKHATRVPEALWRIPVRYANTAGPRVFVESIATKERIERTGGRREERREERC